MQPIMFVVVLWVFAWTAGKVLKTPQYKVQVEIEMLLCQISMS